MNDDTSQNDKSLDDILEEERQEDHVDNMDPALPEDGETPAAPATDLSDTLPEDHPSLDTDMDAHEQYDEGETTGSGAKDRDETDEKPSPDGL